MLHHRHDHPRLSGVFAPPWKRATECPSEPTLRCSCRHRPVCLGTADVLGPVGGVLGPTTVAGAEAAGVAGRTRRGRAWSEGLVTPDYVTAGGHARWDVEALREQLRALRLPPGDSHDR